MPSTEERLTALEAQAEGTSIAVWISSLGGSPGHVVDPGVARSTSCLGIELGEEHGRLVYSKGVVGALDEEQRALYCQQGVEAREATPEQKKRLVAMESAGKACGTKATGDDTHQHISAFFTCLGDELRSRGVQAW